MKIKPIFSTEKTIEEAMADLQSQYKQEFGDEVARFVIFFSTSNFDPHMVSKKIQEVFDGVEVAGCTTAGELVSGRMLKNSIVAMVFDGEATSAVSVGVVEHIKEEWNVDEVFQSFEHAFGKLNELDLKKHVGIVLIDGMSGAEERIMDRIGDLTSITFIGGSAGDDGKFQQTFVFANGQAYADAAVLVLLKLENGFDVIKTQSFRDSGKYMIATKVDEANREVVEFNDRPAVQVYAEKLGTSVEEVEHEFMSHPTALMIGAEPYVRSPQRLDGSTMKFFCNVKEGANLSILNPTDIVEETREAVKKKISELGHISGLLNFHCILRTQELEKENRTEEYGRIFSDIPTVGFSTYGEEYVVHMNQTATMLVFK